MECNTSAAIFTWSDGIAQSSFWGVSELWQISPSRQVRQKGLFKYPLLVLGISKFLIQSGLSRENCENILTRRSTNDVVEKMVLSMILQVTSWSTKV